MSRLVALSLLVVLSLVLVNVANARGLLATTSTIEGRVTAVSSVSDQPLLSVTTHNGTGYVLRSTDASSIASARTGSRIRATGSLTDGVFVATSVELISAARSARASVAMQQTTVVGVITAMNTAADPPQIIIDTGTGMLMLVTLPGPSRVSDLQLGASVTATGSLANNNLTATSFTVLSRPLSEANDVGDDDDDDDDNNENSDDDNNENSDDDDNNENGADDDDDDDDDSDNDD